MDFLDAVKLLTQKNGTSGSTSTSTNAHMITATATSDSADGKVYVDFGGLTITGDDSQSVELPTTVDVRSGDIVQVTLVGADGTGKSPTVIGVVGGGDRTKETILSEISARETTDETVTELSTTLSQTASDLTAEITTAQSTADSATAAAKTAKSTADTAKSTADDAYSRTLRVQISSSPADATGDTSALTATVWRGGQQLTEQEVAMMGLVAWYVGGSRVATGYTYTCAAGTAVECRLEG